MIRPHGFIQPHSLYEIQKERCFGAGTFQPQPLIPNRNGNAFCNSPSPPTKSTISTHSECVNECNPVPSNDSDSDMKNRTVSVDLLYQALQTGVENQKDSLLVKKLLRAFVERTKIKQTRAPTTVEAKHDNSRKQRGFACPKCPKVYKHECNLKAHYKSHTSEAYVCEYCNKRFGRKANCIEHKRVHTGEKPFQCHVCKERFRQQTAVKHHMKKHTSNGKAKF